MYWETISGFGHIPSLEKKFLVLSYVSHKWEHVLPEELIFFYW